MAKAFRALGWRVAGKLLLVAGLGAAAVQVTGLPSAAPQKAAPASARPAQPKPATAPVRPPLAAATPVVKPAAADTAFVIKRILDVPEPIRIGDWHWDEAGVPAGEIVITADLEAGTLSVFRGGYEIGTAAIIYGIEYKPTPTGLFTITQKDKDHVSNLYDAPMPYMMRLTNDGISIHGSRLTSNGATHGCIGVPIPFAAKLFAAVKLGDPVLVTNAGLRALPNGVPRA